MEKLIKKDVKDWPIKLIINIAISLGLEYGMKGEDVDILKENKKVLVWAINKKIKTITK